MRTSIKLFIKGIAFLFLCVGAFVLILAYGSPYFGLGEDYSFVFYRLFGIARRSFFIMGVMLFLSGAVLLSLTIFVRERHIKACLKLMAILSKKYIFAPIKRLLQMSVGQLLKIAAVNIIVVFVCLIGLESLARVFLPLEPSIYGKTQPGQYSRFHPYLQSSNEGPLNAQGVWHDPLHNIDIPYSVRANSLGFRIDRELDTTTVYQKAPNERVVLIFGGSAVYGFGNTSNETTTAGQLQQLLNEGQHNVRYTVFNMGNGGWVAYQEFIALNLYGMNLQPDWIIFMDGRNDLFTISTLSGDDVGFHFATGQLRQYIDGYLYRQPKPVFFRSEWENDLLQASFLYRYISGKRPVPFHVTTRFPYKRDWSYVEKTVDFYLHVQRSVLGQCPDCHYILSTQPIYRSYRKRLTTEEMADYRRKYADLVFDGNFISDRRFEDVLMYAYSRIIQDMPAVCATHRHCVYKAMDDVFPKDYKKKEAFFVDDVHLNDEGNRLTAQYYAKQILETDRAH